MSENEFFDKPTEASLLKAELVSEYFDVWSNIIIPSVRRTDRKIAYIDFFSGPGLYKDGSKSTPILIIEKALNNPEKSEMLVSVFNDSNEEHIKCLEDAINDLPNVENLSYEPEYHNIEIDTESTIIEELQKRSLIPTLFFIDPWGYKGLSLNLISAVLKDWGSDGIFFFNYARINRALSNSYMVKHMEELFGKDRKRKLVDLIKGQSADHRESIILDYLMDALHDMGGHYVLDFRFPSYGQVRTSHYLIFVSKHILGYRIMKNMLSKRSSFHRQGVGSFSFETNFQQEFLYFEEQRPLDKLEQMLIDEFKGRTLTMHEVFDEHDVGNYYTRRYTETNYKDALRNLERRGDIKTDPPASKRPPRKDSSPTFGPNVKVTFKK